MSAIEPARTVEVQHSGSVKLVADNDTNNNNSPWHKVEPYMPAGYVINSVGVYLDKNDKEFICGPCWVAAMTRSSQSTDWGIVVHWIDQDGHTQSMAIPIRKLSEPRAPVVGDLASMGLKIVPGKGSKLMTYMGSFTLPKSYRLRSVSQLGWIEADDGSPLFVLPRHQIGLGAGGTVVFQPEAHSPTTRTMYGKASLKQWQAHVANPCRGNPYLIFSLCAGFSGALLKFAGLDCGGFHFYGTSSKGKTTALQVAASLWGSGADPAIADDSYISRWNTTGNALEATAAAHNDGLLTLDEMGTCDSRDFGNAIYNLFGGKGRSRLNKNSTLQVQRSWRIMGLSTGEISCQEKIEETKQKAMLGQLARLADVPITGGIIVESHGEEPGVFVNRLKKACGQTYGTAGPAFLEKLAHLEPDTPTLQHTIQSQVNTWEQRLNNGMDMEPHQRRVVRRIATVAAAGTLATRFGIIEYPEAEILRAVLTIRDAWLRDEGNKPEAERGIDAIREFILGNPGRFRPILSPEPPIRDQAGYVDHGNDRYLFTKDGFKEACKGFPKDTVLNELERRDLLFINETGRKMSKHPIPDLGKRLRLYAVRSVILEAY